MYHAHFGLTRPLFDSGIAQDQAVFRSGKHERLIANFKLALASPCSVVTLTGQPGIGKTTLTSAALRASQTRLAMAWLNGAVTNATELLELLLAELGLVTERTTRVERLQLWRQFHSEMSATESRVFVIAERADDLPIEVLRALDGLTAPDATGYTGANVVLLGQAGLDKHLEAPALESLRQRVRLRARLEPLTEGELQDYLRHQVACAGGDFDRVFAPGAVATLYRHTAGVARLANHLCDTALTLAAGEEQKLLTAALIGRVATTLLGLTAPVTQAPSEPVAPAAAVPAPVALAAPTPPVATPTPVAVPPTPILTGAPGLALLATPTAMVAPSQVPTPLTATPAPVTATATPAGPTPSTAAPSTLASPAVQPASATAPAAPSPAAPIPATPFEFDGEATEIPDVSIVDFPVLTDAIDELPLVEPPKVSPAPVRPAPPVAREAPSVSREPPAPVAPRPAASPPARRIETAYLPSKPLAAATPAPVKRAEPPAAVQPDSDPEADDVLRQTQTMRAISIAKSIDDISNSMAETLFGEAELDDLNAALAASIDDSTGTSSAPWVPAPVRLAPSAPPASKAPVSTGDDLLDLLDLTSDATLELMDDSHDHPSDGRRSATRR